MLTYTVTVTNNTTDLVLTPAAVIVHGGTYAPPGAGGMASAGLEVLAESGHPGDYMRESMDAGGTAYQAGDGPFHPEDMVTVDITAAAGSMITVVSMYAHTNDTIAVATLNLEDGALETGTDFDAGTEDNSADPMTFGSGTPGAGDDTDPQASISPATHDIDGHMTVAVSIA